MIEIRPGVWVEEQRSISNNWLLQLDIGKMPLPSAVTINGQRYEKKK